MRSEESGEEESGIAAVPGILKAVLMKGYHFSQLKGRVEGKGPRFYTKRSLD